MSFARPTAASRRRGRNQPNLPQDPPQSDTYTSVVVETPPGTPPPYVPSVGQSETLLGTGRQPPPRRSTIGAVVSRHDAIMENLVARTDALKWKQVKYNNLKEASRQLMQNVLQLTNVMDARLSMVSREGFNANEVVDNIPNEWRTDPCKAIESACLLCQAMIAAVNDAHEALPAAPFVSDRVDLESVAADIW